MEIKLTRTNDSNFIYGPVTQDFWDFNAPINVNPAEGGEGVRARDGDLTILEKKLSNCPGWDNSVNQKCQKQPHPGAKNLNRQNQNNALHK